MNMRKVRNGALVLAAMLSISLVTVAVWKQTRNNRSRLVSKNALKMIGAGLQTSRSQQAPIGFTPVEPGFGNYGHRAESSPGPIRLHAG